MKKNFLLLFLMALLPLAGWAQTAVFGSMSLGKYTYGDGTAWPVPQVKDSEGAILPPSSYTVVAGAFSDEACTQAVTTPANMVANGTTKYWRKVTGEGVYAGQEAKAWFTVEKAELTLTLKDGQYDRTYGEAQTAVAADGSDFNITGLKYSQTWAAVKKGSAPTYSTADNNFGTAKAITFEGGWTADNYKITFAAATLKINPKDLSTTATITNEQGDVVYTGNAITGVYTVKDGPTTLTAGTDYTVSTVTNVIANFKPTITFQGNYTGSKTVATGFAVTPAPIAVSIEPIEVEYNGTDQADQYANATFKYSGIVGADLAYADAIKGAFTAPTSVQVASEAVNAGNYTLVITGGNTNTATNYYFASYIPGKLTITPKDLTIKANPAAKNVGDADPAFTLATPAELIAGHTVSGVTFTRAAGESAGTYDITPDVSGIVVKAGDDVVTGNYNPVVATTKGKLTIGLGAIYVSINDAEKFYGAEDPTFTYEVTGLQDGDELAAFTIVRDKAGTAAGEIVGSYSMTATVANPDPAKYTSVTVAPGIFTIKKAQLTFTMPAQTVGIGAGATALKKDDIKVEGINNSDVATSLYDLAITGDVSANATHAAGYTATLTTAAQAKYEIITDATTNPVTTGNIISGKLIVGTGAAAAINFTSENTDAAKIANQYGETQNVTINFAPRNGRTYGSGAAYNWKATKWTTMVLPFDISVAELSQVLGYAIVNVIDKTKTVVDGTGSKFYGKLTMTGGNGGDGVLKANKPFLVKIASDINSAIAYNFGPRTIVKADDTSVDAGGDCTFVGTYVNKTVTKNDEAAIWFMNGDEEGWQFIGDTSSATWTIRPFEAYIDMSNVPAASRNITFYAEEIDGTVTAIKGISVDENGRAKLNAEGWYNLNGMKLQGAPIQKGVYIYNGKKYVVK